jgi:hypothetical protein
MKHFVGMTEAITNSQATYPLDDWLIKKNEIKNKNKKKMKKKGVVIDTKFIKKLVEENKILRL